MHCVTEPRDAAELNRRARALGGRTIAEIARELGEVVPSDPRRSKGAVGRLVERALGASFGGSGPDFVSLGIELKTLPVDARGRVRESTFVCLASLGVAQDRDWESSKVRRKLARVLFVAIEAERAIELCDRRVGAAFAWTPSEEEEAILRADWEELAGSLGAGEVEVVDAHRGRALQLRPKAANARVRTRSFDAEGSPILAAPRAFYLRASFTQELVRAAGLAPAGTGRDI
jgi:DNA mismatch repair protein MutH